MNIKKIVSIASLFFVTCVVSGQVQTKTETIDITSKEYALPVKKFYSRGNKPYAKAKQEINKTSGYALTLNYHKTNFLNSQFSENLENGDLSQNFGTSLNSRLIFGYPFMFDINWFSSRFEYTGDDDSNPLFEAPKLRHRGLELAVNFALLPSNSHFIPYIGIGYQTASLIASNLWPIESADDENNNSDIETIKYKSNCSGVIWKSGIMLEYWRYIFNVEYKQTLGAKSEKASNQLSIGIGIMY